MLIHISCILMLHGKKIRDYYSCKLYLKGKVERFEYKLILSSP